MLLNRYKQQPGEKIKRIVDLTEWLEADETIADLTVTISPETDTPFTCPSAVIDPAGKKFAYYLQGGESGTTYKVQFSTETQTQIREDEIEVEVEEI